MAMIYEYVAAARLVSCAPHNRGDRKKIFCFKTFVPLDPAWNRDEYARGEDMKSPPG
jgi:hypothetical protein